MKTLQQTIKNKIIKDNLEKYLINCNFGLEKENVRVDYTGHLALSKHPVVFGDKKKNPYITTDFSESQIEMVTPPCNTLEETYEFMGALNDIVSIELKNELLWPQSNPPILPVENEIPISEYNGAAEQLYREGLAKKYGRKKQLLSGVHYNFSFKEEFLSIIYEDFKDKISFKEFKNNLYLNISRNFLKYKDLLIYLTAASPIFDKTYSSCCVKSATKLNENSCYFSNTDSLRNSDCGYKNITDFIVSYESIEEYTDDLKSAIELGHISGEREYYSPIRLKTSTGTGNIQDLINNGVEYLEFRILDLNPLTEFGISIESLRLLHAFVIYMAFNNSNDLNGLNFCDNITPCPKKNLNNYKESSFIKTSLEVLSNIKLTLEELNILDDKFKYALNDAENKINNKNNTIATKVFENIKNSSFIEFHINIARESFEKSKSRVFSLRGFEDMELSTQILLRDAIKRGIKFNIMDRAENFISLKFDGKLEYVKQATKTSKDSYITALLMENKEVTKKVLLEKNIRVPNGNLYLSAKEAIADFNIFEGKSIVIKPKSTNFGLGISIFKTTFTRNDFEKAVDIAFSEDSSILIEEFISGKEYRFLVIDDNVVGILHRAPANVTGNGKNTITELVEIKNRDFLRGSGYLKPLEKIKLDVVEEMFLKSQGLNFDYIPKNNETIYLRENSNISTGGDSLDFTDEMHDSYKEIALKCAKAANAKITGIDIMIDDIYQEANNFNHGIIEMNFNPAIHIHCFPYKGKNRFAGERVLDLLFKK